MTKSKFQKKKDREREVRKKILSRRERKHAQEKENAKFDAEEKAVAPKQRPIRNDEFRAAQRMRDMEIRMQLEHNLELLKGLQAEYEEELKKREEYVKSLKEKGVDVSDLEETTEEVPNLIEKATELLGKKAEEKEKIRDLRSSYDLDAEATLSPVV